MADCLSGSRARPSRVRRAHPPSADGPGIPRQGGFCAEPGMRSAAGAMGFLGTDSSGRLRLNPVGWSGPINRLRNSRRRGGARQAPKQTRIRARYPFGLPGPLQFSFDPPRTRGALARLRLGSAILTEAPWPFAARTGSALRVAARALAAGPRGRGMSTSNAIENLVERFVADLVGYLHQVEDERRAAALSIVMSMLAHPPAATRLRHARCANRRAERRSGRASHGSPPSPVRCASRGSAARRAPPSPLGRRRRPRVRRPPRRCAPASATRG